MLVGNTSMNHAYPATKVTTHATAAQDHFFDRLQLLLWRVSMQGSKSKQTLCVRVAVVVLPAYLLCSSGGTIALD